MQLPEKYKENFDVSSEGPSQGRSEEDKEEGRGGGGVVSYLPTTFQSVINFIP